MTGLIGFVFGCAFTVATIYCILSLLGAPKIVVTDRSDDYHACLEEEPGVWGCGPTPYAAIGSLVNARREQFGCEIEWRIGPE